MAQNDYALLRGREVALSGLVGPFRLCGYCGSSQAEVGEGSGPHLASLDCRQCGRHLAWLSRDHLAALAAADGRAA